ncbi:MAG: chemotaxis protein CheB [Chloroflexota bacterium]|nr:chemotaxis protein CheB [Chloroflexota bacterium]
MAEQQAASQPNGGRDIIVIGGSAGGFEPLLQLVGDLPATLPAALFVVIHVAPNHSGLLAPILDRTGPLAAVEAEDGMPIQRGTICVAPPDQHMVLYETHTALNRGPRENRTRPAIDPLFRTAARAFGSRVVGVLLSGMLDDGALGMMVIKSYGGTTIVQAPAEARYSSMPWQLCNTRRLITFSQLRGSPIESYNSFTSHC